MYSILLVFEPRDFDLPENRKKWDDFLKYKESTSTTASTIDVLSTSVLLIRIDSTLATLQETLFRFAGLKYRYAIFPDGIEWRETVQG